MFPICQTFIEPVKSSAFLSADSKNLLGKLALDREETVMFLGRRKSQRRTCREVSKVRFGASSFPRDCVITDVSDGGVKLIAEDIDLPSEFTIIFATGQHRHCRLAWRIGCEFGAEFISAAAA